MLTEHIAPPWSQTTIDALARHQMDKRFSPYLCGNPRHKDKPPRLLPTPGGLICISFISKGCEFEEECFYLQQWAHRPVLTMIDYVGLVSVQVAEMSEVVS